MFKRKIIWSARAKIEIIEILEFYNNRNGNTKYSRKIYSEIKVLLELCRTHNFIGKQAGSEVERVLTFGDFLIFYEVGYAEITVLTIWSSKRNPADLKL
jgi:toxin YoeB